MPKDTLSTPPADAGPVDPAVEAKIRERIEAELRREYEDKLRAAGVPLPVAFADGKPATYYHQQGRELVGVPVIAAGNTLHDPNSGAVLVTGAQSSPQPANGRFVLKS
jgi:hypothetical protein